MSSDAGIASHNPQTPKSFGKRIKPGIIKTIPLSSMYAIDRFARSQL